MQRFDSQSLLAVPSTAILAAVASVMTIAGFVIGNDLVRVGAWIALLAVVYLLKRVADRSGRDLSDMRSALNEVSLNQADSFDEELKTTYYVGETSAEDREVREHRTIAAPQQPLAWRSLYFAATDAKAHNAHNLGVRVTTSVDSQHATFMVIDEGAGRVRGLVAFLPPILGGTDVEWRTESAWPGVWDQLRTRGTDDFYFEQSLAGRISITLNVVLPHSMTRPVFRSRPSAGSITTNTINGREALEWHLVAASRGTYKFSVGAERRP